MRIRAHERLKATAGLTSYEENTEVHGAFDTTKSKELQHLQQVLRRHGVIFRYDVHHLYHKSNPKDIDDEVQIVLKCVHDLGHNPRVRPNTLNQERFSIKCQTELVIQRLVYDVRIFYCTT